LEDVELRLVVELMENSRRADRELAETLDTCQPAVRGTIKKLEMRVSSGSTP